MSKVIAHIDLNAFFVRCEELKDPSLINKAVAIGHEGRCGIISTCSYEARKHGVSSGMPTFKALQNCPNLLLISGDYHFYNAKSAEFFRYLSKFSKKIERASIDECYVDFTEEIKGIKDVPKYFRNIQEGLLKETGLKCSIGIAPTRFLAKMGSDIKKPMGLTIIHKKDIPQIIYPLGVEATFGIGKKTYPRLIANGYKTIGDLKKAIDNKDTKLLSLIGNAVYYLESCLNGTSDDNIYTEFYQAKSIGNSSTLEHNTNNYFEVNRVLERLCEEVSFRSKRENLLGTTIQIVVKEDNFVSHNKSKTLKEPFNDKETIFKVAKKLYMDNYQDLNVRLIGVTLQNLVSIRDMNVQMGLFDYEKHEEESATKLFINAINRKFDKPVLKRASEVKKDDNK